MVEPPRPAMTEKESRDYAMFVHLSALSGLIVPFGDLLGPLILWVIKKDASPFVDRHGKAAVNFHLSVLIYGAVLFVVGLVLLISIVGILLLIPLIIVAAIAAVVAFIVLPIVACLKAQNGEEYTYPLAIRFLK